MPEVSKQGREIGVFLALSQFPSCIKRIEQNLRRRLLYTTELLGRVGRSFAAVFRRNDLRHCTPPAAVCQRRRGDFQRNRRRSENPILTRRGKCGILSSVVSLLVWLSWQSSSLVMSRSPVRIRPQAPKKDTTSSCLSFFGRAVMMAFLRRGGALPRPRLSQRIAYFVRRAG